MSNNTAAGGHNDPSNRLDENLEADITHLNALLSNGSLNDSSGTDDIVEILARLESADGVARDVEGRLDELLGTLDNLLTSLETRDEERIPENEGTITVKAEFAVTSTESNICEPALGR
jgi:hypothetical protein